MSKRFGLFLLAVLVFAPVLASAQELIERIDLVGNERVTRETIMYYLQSREGDPYNEDLLRKDFRVLWSTGFFADIKMEVEDGARGKIVKILLEENPVIKTIAYKTGKKVKEDDIVNKLKETDQYILPYSYYSPFKLQRVVKTIESLLVEKGLQAAKVDVRTEKRGKSEVEVEFVIDEGPKARIGDVEFTGRPKLPESTLREAMKENQGYTLYSVIAGKNLLKQNKMADDLAALKKKFQENGYMEATVGEPKYEQVSRRTWPLFKSVPMTKIVVPVDAGFLYRVGEVNVEGNKTFATWKLLEMIRMKPGDVYSTAVREKAVEDISELFRNFGHLWGQVVPVENLDPKNKVVNVTFNINEGELCILRRLEFKGNVFTKDKVIRREMLIREGDLFRLALFKDSILRIKQLGLVDVEKDPDIKPDPADPTQFDVAVQVKELQRNNIQFTAGYSGYEGTFIAVSYSTVNFLGAGENLELTAQYGKRIKNYVFGFTEPYVFDNPISLGFNLYSRYVIYPYLYNQDSRGIDLNLGARIVWPWQMSLTYSFQKLNISQYTSTTATEGEDVSLYYTSYYSSLLYSGYYGFGHYNSSSISGSIYRSTIDSPLTPSRGTLYLASVKYAGTFLGGEIHMVKPRFEFTRYQPITEGQSIGVHVQYSFAKALRNTEIPFWERFYMGGERDIRGYEIYTIGERDENGYNLGGVKSFVFNAEYILHVGGGDSPLYLIVFHDRGNAYGTDQKVSLKDMYTSTGLEARIFVPALRVPFRLIFSYNNRRIYEGDSNFAFRFAIGTTF
jgi:outer membrane protein insertion porin family